MRNKNLVITCLAIALLSFGAIFLSSSAPSTGMKPSMTRTYGGLGSNLNVYEYRASDGTLYIIVQGNGETGPVAIHR